MYYHHLDKELYKVYHGVYLEVSDMMEWMDFPNLICSWYYIKWKSLNNLPKYLDFVLFCFWSAREVTWPLLSTLIMENTWGSRLIPGSVDTRKAFYSYPRGILNELGRAILQFSTPGPSWLKLQGKQRKQYVYCLVTMINVGCQSNNLSTVF